MRVATILGVMVALSGVAMATPATVVAQEVVPEEQAPVEVTEELLDRFVEVYPSIMEIAQSVQAELSQAETAEEAQGIQAEAQTTIAAVLDEGDMTVREYEAVVEKLREDPELMAEVEARLVEQAEDNGALR
jgi:hypothetical protein